MMILTVFAVLASCSHKGKSEELALAARMKYIGAEKCTMRAVICADYGDRTYEYELEYIYKNAEDGEITVLSPDIIAGLHGITGKDSLSVVFDDVALETGPLSKSGLTPVSALPSMVSAWKSGYITETDIEKSGDTECVAVTLKIIGEEDEVLQRVWFRTDTYEPVRGEILVDGAAVIKCEFKHFAFN